MARPKKNTEMFSKPVSFRLTATDHAAYQEKVIASGLSPSNFFRDVVLKNKTRIYAAAQLNDNQKELIRYFRAASNNMNQLAKRCNIDNKRGILTDKSYIALLESLQTIERYLRQAI